MPQTVPPNVVRNLRQFIAKVVSGEKAYDVPSICNRLGLASGDGEEAFRSKSKYVQRRILEVDANRVLEIARELTQEYDDFDLGEELAKFDEANGRAVSELSRRRLTRLFDGQPFVTEIEDVEFIRRVWPIAQIRAVGDSLGRSAEEFILQHAVRNDNLTQHEVLESLGLLTCSRAQLFKFLVAVTRPEVQSAARQFVLARQIDEILQLDGYTMVEAGKISGSLHYQVRLAESGSPSDATVSAALSAFDPTQVHARWTALLERRATDPAGAITLARTLLEDVCKWILDEAHENWQEADDLPVLYRKLSKALRLAPDDHTEQVFKQILGSCQSVVESLGALRNKLSDAHSQGPKRAKPQARHAELAVNLAGAMATFLVSTWEARQIQSGTHKK